MNKLFSVGQVAAKLGVNPYTVRGLIHAGRLPALRVGSRFRIDEAELVKLSFEPDLDSQFPVTQNANNSSEQDNQNMEASLGHE